jgi:hypothetical protein
VKDRERPIARIIASEPTAKPLDLDIPRRVSRSEAKRILAGIPRPTFSPEVIDDTLQWMKEDRSDWRPNDDWRPKK